MDYNEELEASLHFTLPFQVTATILFTIIFIIGLCGNIMIIYGVFKSPGMQTLTNLYLVSLDFSDSLVLLIAVTGVTVPLASVYKYTTIYGAAGSAMIYLIQYVGANRENLCRVGYRLRKLRSGPGLGRGYPMRVG